MSDLKAQIESLARNAKNASRALMTASTQKKNALLLRLAELLDTNYSTIEAANKIDLEQGKKSGLSQAMLDRLALNSSRIQAMADGVRAVATLSDPVGEAMKQWTQPNGIHISKVRVPIGVIGMIYESRPNVTIDASALCLKTGNAVILRGGSEAFESNQCLANLIAQAAKDTGFDPEVASFVATKDRDAILHLCKQDAFIDLLIPRGGEGLIRAVVEHARMPVIKHFQGICHIYVHEKANLEMAEKIIINAKCQRPGVCNAVETILIDESIAQKFLPPLFKSLRAQGVKIFADAKISSAAGEKLEEPESWSTEYLDLILAVKAVKGIDDAIQHIETYGSRHSDAIVTEDQKIAEHFLASVDSAAVYWNASTRFTDGAQFGMGAEIGISTDKIHARGPMALEELTSYKYLIRGSGQIRK
ncbi:MAG: glutamate-5-semialdehyde dehydrogenase [Verrucomicrobiota bacterium]